MTLCYIIKHNNIGLPCNVIKEVYIIMQVSITSKLKCAYTLLRQIYIIDTKTVNPIF